MKSLEARTAYKFRNSLLLAEALTHPSLAYETQRPHFDNQRLEYLGDAVLQLVLTEDLFTMFPGFAEGELTKLRSRLVSREALHVYATSINLGQYLLMGKGEEASGGRQRASTLADGFEALIGAIYIDSGGIDEAAKFIRTQCEDAIQAIIREPVEVNPKGELQELLQGLSGKSPKYQTISQEGPDHDKIFRVRVLWNDLELASARGKSKKAAETRAAGRALKFRIWEEDEDDVEADESEPGASSSEGAAATTPTEQAGDERRAAASGGK